VGREKASTEERTGSSMSSRQIARAAVDGRKVTFQFHTLRPITGYVVGQDDFHWFVIDPSGDNPNLSPETLLVHKGSAAVIKIHSEPTLSTEPEQGYIEKVGSAFWQFCNRTYFGINPATPLENAS
jgi:hypothetical protein